MTSRHFRRIFTIAKYLTNLLLDVEVAPVYQQHFLVGQVLLFFKFVKQNCCAQRMEGVNEAYKALKSC